MTAQEKFKTILDTLSDKNPDVEKGKMMSADGIKYKGKNFAFIYKGEMTFRLGKNYDIQAHSIKEIRYLSPFKNKAPMKAWFIIGENHKEKWLELSEVALSKMIDEQK